MLYNICISLHVYLHITTCICGNAFVPDSAVTLNVEASYDIHTVKAIITELHAVPTRQQHLFHNAEELVNGRTLSNYNISTGMVLELIYDGSQDLFFVDCVRIFYIKMD